MNAIFMLLLAGAAAAQSVSDIQLPLPDFPDIPDAAISEVIAVRVISVQNNSLLAVTCAIKWGTSRWGDWFTIPAGGEWSDTVFFGGAKLQCRPPVRAIIYTLQGGGRYSLLPASSGGIELVEVTTRP